MNAKQNHYQYPEYIIRKIKIPKNQYPEKSISRKLISRMYNTEN
jgi:hypothetical protein